MSAMLDQLLVLDLNDDAYEIFGALSPLAQILWKAGGSFNG
ncbi:MAG: hypothetical protein PHQ34_11600 [Methanothrix sp.]|nr:hypothetical protein [Methanothrix sp.]